MQQCSDAYIHSFNMHYPSSLSYILTCPPSPPGRPPHTHTITHTQHNTLYSRIHPTMAAAAAAAAAAATGIECPICFEEITELTRIALTGCGHDAACVRCCTTHVETTAQRMWCGNNPVPCYTRGCNQKIGESDLIALCNHGTHSEDSNASRQATLAKCLRLFEPWEIQPVVRSEENQAWFDAHVKMCPQCRSPTERFAGCKEVICGCGAFFCSRCGLLCETQYVHPPVECIERTF